MRRLLMRSGIAILVAQACIAWAADAKDDNPLEPLDRFVGGSWVVRNDDKGEGPKGTRVTYEWGLNRRLLKSKSFLMGKDGDRLVYESVYYWHPTRKTIVFHSISSDGGIFDGELECKGDMFTYRFDSLTVEKTSSYRQTLQFQDPDTVHWTVSAQKGDDWVTVIDKTQRRERR